MENNNSNNHYKLHQQDPFSQNKINKCKRGFCGFFVVRPRITLLLIISIVVLGFFGLFNIPREADPEVKIPVAVVTTFFPGASPADIESLVTDKVESKIEELDNLKLVQSNSILGLSSVVVEFEAEADLEQSIRDLKDKASEISNLPDDAEDPIVTEIRIDDTPIITFSLASNISELELKEIGEEIQDELESIPGVSDVSIIGVRQRQYKIYANQGELERLNISLPMVVGAIAGSNIDSPLGNITISETNYNIRTIAKINSLEELKKIVVTTYEGRPILLEDISEIKDDYSERHHYSRLSSEGGLAQKTISLQVYKRTGGNIINIVDSAKQKINQLKENGTIPAEVTVEESNDYSQFIRNDLNTLGRSGIQSVIFIFILLFLALSLREAIISLLAIPMTFLISIGVMYYLGYTLNSLALFSLVLSLGLLVDAFIIILEGIFHNIRVGYGAKDSALLAISHYKYPLLAGTLTTISAFVPMLLVSGVLGEFLKVLPITISITLFSSLFVSLAIVPGISSYILKRRPSTDVQAKESLLEKYLTKKLTKKYIKRIDVLLKSKKEKKIVLGALSLLFLVSLGLLISGIIPVELFPRVDVDFSFIDIEMPIGTDLEATNQVVEEVENYLYTRPEIKSFVTSVGQSSAFGFSSSQSSEHLASINITLVDEKFRDKKSFEINDEMRNDLMSIKRGKITVREISAGPPTGSPIEVRITGPDLEVLDNLQQKLVGIMGNTAGVIEIETDKDVSPADLTFKINKEALAQSGLTVGEVSSFLRMAIYGITATEITVDGEDIDVIIKISENVVDSIEELKNLSIQNNFGQSVKLSRLADFSLQPALATIRHRDFERSVDVRANLEEGYTATKVVPQIEKEINKGIIPKGYSYDFGGEVEDIEQSFSELWNAMIVALLLIVLILVLEFDSFRKPIIIVLTMPLMVIGVVVGMLIFQLAFSFSVFLGLISLAGIIVNDAIVMIDKATRNVDEHKMKPRQAIANAGATRLQPIMLTTLTTIIGILPLAFTDEFWFGLSIAMIFGLAFTTMLQLFVVPILYLKLEGKGILKKINFQ